MRTRRSQMMCLLLARSRCSINTVSWMRRPCTGWFLRLVPRGHIPPRESWNTSKEWDQLQYFGHLKWRANSLEKILILGEIEGRGRRGRQRMSWLDSISDSIDMNLSTRQEIVKVRGTWRAAVHRVTKSQTRLSDWTTSWGQDPILGWSGPAPSRPPLSMALSFLGRWSRCPSPSPGRRTVFMWPHTLLHPEHGTSFTQLIPTRLMIKSVLVSWLRARTLSYVILRFNAKWKCGNSCSKIIRNFKTTTAALTMWGAHLSTGALGGCPGGRPMKPALLRTGQHPKILARTPLVTPSQGPYLVSGFISYLFF